MSQEQQATYKIYSRKRLCLNSGNKRRNRKIKNIMPFIMIIIIAISVCFLVWKSIDPIFETICKDEAKAIATKITNEQSTIIIKQYDYEDFFTIQKDENNKIQMISANILKINEISSDIALNVQNQLNNYTENDISIPLGSATGIKLFAGLGPRIKVKISTIGTIDTNLKSEFIEKSINQTLHRVYLEVESTVNILTPFFTIEEKIYNQVMLGENVILGEIPSTYYNLEGLKDNSNALDIIE